MSKLLPAPYPHPAFLVPYRLFSFTKNKKSNLRKPLIPRKAWGLKRVPPWGGLVFFLFAVILSPYSEAALAANLVTGRYLSASGTNVVLVLSIQNPSPSNLIIEQYLSPGNSIVATSPRAIKVDAAQNKVKWLFRNTQSGDITLSIQLKAPLKGNASARVRYRAPNGGAFTELQISP